MLVEKLPPTAELAEREQVINAFDYINRLLLGTPHARSVSKVCALELAPAIHAARLGTEER